MDRNEYGVKERRQTNEARTRNCSWLFFGVSLIFFLQGFFEISFSNSVYTYIYYFFSFRFLPFCHFFFLSFLFYFFFFELIIRIICGKGKNVRCFWGYASRKIWQDIVTWQLIGNLLTHPLSIAWIDAHFCKIWKTMEMYSIKFLESRGNYS